MLSIDEVDVLAKQGALAAMDGSGVRRVFSRPTIDSYGGEALFVTVVLDEAIRQGASGRTLLDIISMVNRRIEEAGDGRFAIIEFRTEAELAENDDMTDDES